MSRWRGLRERGSGGLFWSDGRRVMYLVSTSILVVPLASSLCLSITDSKAEPSSLRRRRRCTLPPGITIRVTKGIRKKALPRIALNPPQPLDTTISLLPLP